MNFANYELLNHDKGEYIDTKILEPDIIKRHVKYPFINAVQTEIYMYKKTDGNIIKRTVVNHKISDKNTRLQERYNNFIPFGKAINQTMIPLIDNHIIVNKIIKTCDKSTKKTTKNIQKYKPLHTNITTNNHIDTEFKPSEYIPSHIKKKLIENIDIPYFKLIIKNLPTYYDKKEMENHLRNTFSKFGPIKYIKILCNNDSSDNLIKDISFIEFEFMTDALKLITSKDRFIIDNSVLLIEKCN